MLKRSTLGGGALLALALLFVGLTILFNYALRGWQIDLTQNHLYTLSPGTEQIIDGLKEPVNLYFFYSAEAADAYPRIKTYAAHVRDFLQEITARSHGKLRLHIIDPQPFSEQEDRATELGIRAVSTDTAGTKLYFGLAGTNSTDGHAAIKFFDPKKQDFLEYDVAKVIYQLSDAKKPVVGWLSSLPMSGGFNPMTRRPRQPWVVYQQAHQLLDLRQLSPDLTRIPADVKVLVLVHPKHLSPAARFAIDQFALRGGHVLLFVDPLAGEDTSGANPSNPLAAMTADHSSHFGKLLGAWGVNFDPHEVIADAGNALTVTVRQGAAPVRDLAILGLDKSDMNGKDVVTAGLSSINVSTAGFLSPKKGTQVKFEPLLQSSAQAEPLPTSRFATLFDPSTLENGFKPTGKRYTLAARVTGDVKTAFPDGPPAGVKLPAGTKVLKASVKPLNLIVVADTDLLANYLWVRQANFFGQQVAQAWANNADLVFNAIDNLSGSSALISIRGRASFSRPFKRVQALRAAAEERFRNKENELEAQLHSTEDKLTALQSKRNDKTSIILTPAQDKELQHFKQERLRIRKQLRQVRHRLDESIKSLGRTLKILDIIVAPLLFALIALLVAALRKRRRGHTEESLPQSGEPAEPGEARS